MTFSAQLSKVLRRERPETVSLAEAVSLATLIEPRLIRTIRLKLHPSFHAGVEADLWFSRFVESRASDGIVFDPVLANDLRQRLASDPSRLDRAWEIVRTAHQSTSSAVRIEEEIAYLAARGDAASRERIREHLRNAVAALVAGDRTGIGMWALRALPRMPVVVREMEEARMLNAASRARLTGELNEVQAVPEWSWILPSAMSATVRVGVRLFDGVLELGPERPGGVFIEAPQTQPLIVRIETETRQETVKFEAGQTVRIRIHGPTLRIHTANGCVNEIETSERLAGEVLDYKPILSQHGEYIDGLNLVEWIRSALFDRPSARVVVTGPPGMGKTALLYRTAGGELLGETASVAYHFFSRISHVFRSSLLACRSLCAAIEQMRPAARIPNLTGFERLRYLLSSPGPRRLVVVVDALDQMDSGPDAQSFLEVLNGPLDSSVSLLVSSRAGEAVERLLKHESTQSLVLDQAMNDAGGRAIVEGIVKNAGFDMNRTAAAVINSPLDAQLAVQNWSDYWEQEPMAVAWDRIKLDSPWTASELVLPGRAVALVCAMQEPIPRGWLEDVLGEPLGDFDPVRGSLGFLVSSGTHFWPRHEVIREFVLSRPEVRNYNANLAIATRLTHWPLPPDPATELQQYVLRYSLHHIRTAADSATPQPSTLQTNNQPAAQLNPGHEALRRRITDLGYIESMCRVLGAGETSRILDLALVGLADSNASSVARLVRENLRALDQEPARIHDLFYREMAAAGYESGDTFNAAFFSAGSPALRPRPLPDPDPPAGEGGSGAARRLPRMRFGPRIHRGTITGCLNLRDGRILSWGDDGLVFVWEMSANSTQEVLRHSAAITQCIERGRDLVVAAKDGAVVLVRDEKKYPGPPHRAAVHGLRNIPGTNRFLSWSADTTIRVWTMEDGEHRVTRELRGHTDEVHSCDVIQGQRWLISVSADCTIRIWDMETMQVRGVLEGHKAPVTHIVVIDDKTFVSASQDTTLKLWDFSSQRLMRSFEGHDLAVLDCSLSDDGHLLSASLDRTMKLWSLYGDRPPVTFAGHHGAVYRCRFLSNDDVVSCSADRTLKRWRVGGELVRTFYGHSGGVRSFVVIPDSSSPPVLVSCSEDRTLMEWLITDESASGGSG